MIPLLYSSSLRQDSALRLGTHNQRHLQNVISSPYTSTPLLPAREAVYISLSLPLGVATFQGRILPAPTVAMPPGRRSQGFIDCLRAAVDVFGGSIRSLRKK